MSFITRLVDAFRSPTPTSEITHRCVKLPKNHYYMYMPMDGYFVLFEPTGKNHWTGSERHPYCLWCHEKLMLR